MNRCQALTDYDYHLLTM